MRVGGLGLAGCGDDDDGLSKGEFATKGDAICNDSNSRFQEAFAEFEGREPSPAELQPVLQKVVEILDDALADFRDLRAPEDFEDDYDAALDKADAIRDQFEGASKDEAKATALLSGEDPFTEVNEELATLGITKCSEGEENEGE